MEGGGTSRQESRLRQEGGGGGGGVPSDIQAQQNKQAPQHQPPDDGKCSLLRPELYDKPLSCSGCGIGWFCFIGGFAFPVLWYAATLLYLGKYYHKDPRERSGLAASAIAALVCSVAAFVTLLALIL